MLRFVYCRILVIIYRRFGTTYQAIVFNGCPETLMTTNVRCITSQKSEYLIYAVTGV